MKETVYTKRYSAPCGELLLGACRGQLCLCDWIASERRKAIDWRLQRLLRAEMVEGEDDVLTAATKQLNDYFRGRRKTFSIPLLMVGTEFQKRVWEELTAIPYGATKTYAEMAARLGKPKSVRAVANANGANAISIFVPCHRVIGTDGSLTGYAGGLAAKNFLLNLERR